MDSSKAKMCGQITENKEVAIKQAPVVPFSGLSRKVLLVDLTNTFSDGFVAGMAAFNFAVETVFDAVTFRHQLAEEHYVAVVIKINEQADLSEVTKVIQDSSLAVPPVVFLSSSLEIKTRIKALRAGGEAFFPVPLNYESFSRTMSKLVIDTRSEIGRVLIVEDEVIREASEYADKLIALGIDVRVVSSDIAVDIVSEWQPNMIVFEMELEHCSGIEMAAIIRQQVGFAAGIPMLFLCEPDSQYASLSKVNFSVDKFLLKPVCEQRIVNSCRILLRRSKLSRQYQAPQERKDHLTGLPDRGFFLSELEHAGSVFKSGNPEVAASLIYIDNLEKMQTEMEQFEVDYLVKEISNILVEKLSTQDILARYSDQSFALISYGRNEDELSEFFKVLQSAVSQHDVLISNKVIRNTMSIGACFFAEDVAPSTVLSQADMVASDILSNSGNKFQIQSTKIKLQEFRAKQKKWQETIANGEFRIVYQPIVPLHGEVSPHYEVLFRMRRSETLPEQFLQTANELGIIEKIDIEMARRVLDIASRKHKDGMPVGLTLNISGKTLKRGAFLKWLKDRVTTLELPSGTIAFAIEEKDVASSLKHAIRFSEIVKQLKQSIVLKQNDADSCTQVMRLMREISGDYLKLDRLFMHRVVEDSRYHVQLKTLTQYGEDIGYKVIGAYVDDASALALLWQNGVHYAQGYFIQKPEFSMTYDFNKN